MDISRYIHGDLAAASLRAAQAPATPSSRPSRPSETPTGRASSTDSHSSAAMDAMPKTIPVEARVSAFVANYDLDVSPTTTYEMTVELLESHARLRCVFQMPWCKYAPDIHG